MAILEANDIASGYEGVQILWGVNFKLEPGKLTTLVGSNGVGKTTLLKTVMGLMQPISGSVSFQGEDVSHLSAHARANAGMVLVPEGRQVFAELSVLDNIRLGAFLQPDDRETRVEAQLQRFPRLRERLHQRAGLLSGGEQQMLAIARALMSRPRILLLDEPSLGLAPKVIGELFAALDDLRRDGMTLLLVDQMAGLALALADRAYVIEGGRIVAHGTAAQIAADDALAQAYLGEQAAH